MSDDYLDVKLAAGSSIRKRSNSYPNPIYNFLYAELDLNPRVTLYPFPQLKEAMSSQF